MALVGRDEDTCLRGAHWCFLASDAGLWSPCSVGRRAGRHVAKPGSWSRLSSDLVRN